LAPGQKGAKSFLERYGEKLICVRYRYDEQRRNRFTTVEIIVEESGWSPPEKPEIVGLRVEFQETEFWHSRAQVTECEPGGISWDVGGTQRKLSR
jgi:hypothetical protein